MTHLRVAAMYGLRASRCRVRHGLCCPLVTIAGFEAKTNDVWVLDRVE
jgi:hypothetical protein